MADKKLTICASKWLKKHTQNIIVPNCSLVVSELVARTESGEIPDILGWCSHTSVLIEVKVSKADFIRDKNKVFREFPEKGLGELRYYVCPEGLIKEYEIPPNWGLLYADEKMKIKIIKQAKKQQFDLLSERSILLSIIRRKNVYTT